MREGEGNRGRERNVLWYESKKISPGTGMSMHNSNTKLIEITIVSVALEINAVDS